MSLLARTAGILGRPFLHRPDSSNCCLGLARVLCLLPSWLPPPSCWNVPCGGLLVNRVHAR